MPLIDDMIRTLRQLLPEACPRCTAPADAGFCTACQREFASVDRPCVRCGQPNRHRRCPAANGDWHIDAIRAPFEFSAPLKDFLKHLKYAGRRQLARPLADLVATRLLATEIRCEVIAAVPLHPRRLRQRTFNQAEEIAGALAARLRMGHLKSGIRRLRDTPPQADLPRRERWRNLERAFAVDSRLDGMRIAILDDVITTGATANALAQALKAAGARRVEAWAVARTCAPEFGLASLPDSQSEVETEHGSIIRPES